MYRFLYYLIFILFIYNWYCLLYFYYFTKLFIYIFRYLFLYFDLFCLYLWCMIRYLYLFLYCLCYNYLLFCFNWTLLNYLDKFLLIYWHFYNTYFFFKFYHLLDNFCLNWIGLLYCYWNLYWSCSCVLVRNLFPIWNSLLKINCKMWSIWDNNSSLLFERYSNSLSMWNISRFIYGNRHLTDSCGGSK